MFLCKCGFCDRRVQNTASYMKSIPVFNGLQWKPVACAVLKHRTAHFTKIGRGVVYRCMYYDKEEQRFDGFPFLLDDNGRVKYLIPQKDDLQVMTLYRKYPMDIQKLSWARTLTSYRLESSDTQDFSILDTVIYFTKPDYNLACNCISVGLASRYFRVASDKRLNIGSLIFRDQDGEKLQGRIIFEQSNKPSTVYPAFDGDIMTFSNAQKWIGIDFENTKFVDSVQIFLYL